MSWEEKSPKNALFLFVRRGCLLALFMQYAGWPWCYCKCLICLVLISALGRAG